MALYPRNVLIVDDEPLIRLILADALGEVGFTVTEASNVLEAVAILGQTQIDAIVTDVDMPGGLNGFDLMRLAAGYNRQIAVIVTSGAHSPAACDLSPGCAFLPKPYRVDDIVTVLNARITAETHGSKIALAG